MKYLITTISALNQLLVIANLPPVNPDELRGSGIMGRRNRSNNKSCNIQSNRLIV